MSAGLGSHYSRLGYLLTRGDRVARVLILHPIESFFATHEVMDPPWDDDPLHDALKKTVKTLLDHQIDFDFGNEVIMKQHAKIEDDRFVIGSASYDLVLVPHSVTWRKSTISLLRKFLKFGGHVGVIEPKPTCVEGLPSDTYDKLFTKAHTIGHWDDSSFGSHLIDTIRRHTQVDCTLDDKGDKITNPQSRITKGIEPGVAHMPAFEIRIWRLVIRPK